MGFGWFVSMIAFSCVRVQMLGHVQLAGVHVCVFCVCVCVCVCVHSYSETFIRRDVLFK